MDAVRSLVPDAHVRAAAVVESDEATDVLQRLPIRREAPFLAIDALILDSFVHALCNAIVSGFVVLRH